MLRRLLLNEDLLFNYKIGKINIFENLKIPFIAVEPIKGP